jgi:predicted PP-loop superfamily ATPase
MRLVVSIELIKVEYLLRMDLGVFGYFCVTVFGEEITLEKPSFLSSTSKEMEDE